MDQRIQILFNGIHLCTPQERADRMMGIGNYIESGLLKNDEITEIVQTLIALLQKENDVATRNLLFRNIHFAYAQKTDLDAIQLTPVVNMLDESGPGFICNTLQLLSMTFNKKYLPVISRYVYYPEDKVREAAVNALTFIQHPYPRRA